MDYDNIMCMRYNRPNVLCKVDELALLKIAIHNRILAWSKNLSLWNDKLNNLVQ